MIILVILAAAGPLAGTLAGAGGARARQAGWATAAGAAIALGSAVYLLTALLHRAPLRGWGGFLYVDSLSCFFLLTVASVTLLAAVGSVAYLSAEEDSAGSAGSRSGSTSSSSGCSRP